MAGSLLKFGRVVGIHPEDNSVDVLLWDGSAQIVGAQLLSGAFASADVGEWQSIDPGLSDADKWDPTAKPKREITACLGEMGDGFWIVVGFQQPQITQMAFAKPDEYIRRYAGGTYQRADAPGTLETVHPAGGFMVFGADRDPDSLEGADYDGKWRIPKTGTASFRVEAQDSGAFKARIRVRASGQVIVENSDGSKIDMTGQSITVTTPNSTIVNATSKCEVNTQTCNVNAQTVNVKAPTVSVLAQTMTLASSILSVTATTASVTAGKITLTGAVSIPLQPPYACHCPVCRPYAGIGV